MKRYQNQLFLLLVILLIALPLWTVTPTAFREEGKEAAVFSGADGQAKELVGRINPAYQPWASPLLQPPSSEIESLLFALQAALGAGFIGYWYGCSVTRARLRREPTGDSAC